MFSCEFCDISKNPFFDGTPVVAASVATWLVVSSSYKESRNEAFAWVGLKINQIKDLNILKASAVLLITRHQNKTD